MFTAIAKANGDEWFQWLFAAIIVISVICLAWIIRRDLRRRKDRGRKCIVCGYDLRATPHTCPECGMPVAGELLRVALNEAALNRDWPVDRIKPRRSERGEKLAFVHAAVNERQGNLLAEQLRARGVWCDLRPGPDGASLVIVPAIDQERAQAIVARFQIPGQSDD